MIPAMKIHSGVVPYGNFHLFSSGVGTSSAKR